MTPAVFALKSARLAAGLTQDQLAERANVTQSTISDMERGAVARVDLAVLGRLAKALGVPAGSLIDDVR